MTFTDNTLLFLATVVAISTTGVLMPGPVMAASMVKGLKSRWAGIHVALGHGIVEFPTIALVYIGFNTVLKDPRVSVAIGLLGGALLLYMGINMVLSRKAQASKLEKVKGPKPKKKGKARDDPFPYPPLVAGIITTATNPYFFLWWATLGAALVLNAVALGLVILVVMSVLHWSIDLGWCGFIGYAVNKSKGLGAGKAYVAVFALCGIIMLVFGGWFVFSAVRTAMGL